MEFQFQVPTKIIFEKGCVGNHMEIFTYCGSRAAIVTGRHSAKESGALSDVERVLKHVGIAYEIYDYVENNPSVETVTDISEKAKKFRADFVIGIGGGSPMDAAKAVAVPAANSFKAVNLFANTFNRALPIVEIPLTSGTGSEVTPYSVLLRKDLQTKVSFGNLHTYPAYALLDPDYTKSMSKTSTVSTAVDAFTHVLEGYFANRSTSFSNMTALEGIRVFGECLSRLDGPEYDDEIREKLMYVFLLGGLTIAQTGVTLPHGMGYCYTYFKNIPHGIANGLFLREYMKLIEPSVKEKTATALKLLGFESVDAFADRLETLIGKPPKLTPEEITQYTELAQIQKGSMANYLIVTTIINILLDLVMIVVLEMGIAGAALATILSEAVSAVMVMYHLCRQPEPLNVRLGEIRMYRGVTGKVVGMGIPTGIQTGVIAFSNIIVQSFINQFGVDAASGCSAYIKIDGFVLLPITSFGLVAMTFTSQNIGAGKTDILKTGERKIMAVSLSYTVIVSLLLELFAKELIGMFNRDAGVIEAGCKMLRILAPGYWMLAITHILVGMFRGSGRSLLAMMIMLVNLVAFRIVFLVLAVPRVHTLDTVFWSYTITWVTAVVSALFFRFRISWDRIWTDEAKRLQG